MTTETILTIFLIIFIKKRKLLMNKKGNLFFLIKSLNQSEKRYFKLFCRTINVESNYIRLFEAIDKQEVYDEKKFKTNLCPGSFRQAASCNQNLSFSINFKKPPQLSP